MRVDMQKGRRMAKLILLNAENSYCFEDLYTLIQYKYVALALIEAFKKNDQSVLESFF